MWWFKEVKSWDGNSTGHCGRLLKEAHCAIEACQCMEEAANVWKTGSPHDPYLVNILHGPYVSKQEAEVARYEWRDDAPPRISKSFILPPEFFTWDNGSIANLVKVIAQEQDFKELPILADALGEAGYENEVMMSHLRESHDACCMLSWLLGVDAILAQLPKQQK